MILTHSNINKDFALVLLATDTLLIGLALEYTRKYTHNIGLV
jgi:hypothetical protein